MSVQIIQTNHGFSLTAAHQFAPGMRVLNLTGITKTTKDRYSIQISLDEHLHPFDELQSNPDDCQTPWIYTNHSCNPNVVIRDQKFVALRSIEPDEPITFDYETTEWEMAEPFQCDCGVASCRSEIRGYKHLDRSERERLSEQTASYLLNITE